MQRVSGIRREVVVACPLKGLVRSVAGQRQRLRTIAVQDPFIKPTLLVSQQLTTPGLIARNIKLAKVSNPVLMAKGVNIGAVKRHCRQPRFT
jgi:hypothetical protein